MSANKSAVVYRLPKREYEDADHEEWDDLAICANYDNAVRGDGLEGSSVLPILKTQLPKVQSKLSNPATDASKDSHSANQPKRHQLTGDGDNVIHGRKLNSKSKDNLKRGQERPKNASGDLCKAGDECIALYDEDGLYYNCTVISVNTTKGTCVVEFDGYGNQEVVNLVDVYSKDHWRTITEDKTAKQYTPDTLSSSSTATFSGTGTCSSSTEGTSSDVTQDIYSESKTKRKRPDSRRGHHHCRRSSDSFQHSALPNFGANALFSVPPPPPSLGSEFPRDLSDDVLSSMLMSWYMAGYHTGYYQGLRSRSGRRSKR